MSVRTKNKRDETDRSTSSVRSRRCLMCGEQFESDGPGNRICKKCKSTQTWRQG